MDTLGAIGPIDYFAKAAAMGDTRNIADPAKQFSTIFYSELMRQIIDTQNGLFSDDGSDGGFFSNIAPMKDAFMGRVAEELAVRGQYDKVLASYLNTRIDPINNF